MSQTTCWSIWFLISFVLFFGGLLYVLVRRVQKENRMKLDVSVNIVFGLAAGALFFLYVPVNAGITSNPLRVIMSSFQNMLQVFSLDGDIKEFAESVTLKDGVLKEAYLTFSYVLFALAPVLAAGVILTFFKNAVSKIRFWAGGYRRVYIFSELNEGSYYLAKSFIEENRDKKGSAAVVFTDVYPENNETNSELLEKANELSAICFKQDITKINVKRLKKKREVSFFVIGRDSEENINHALIIMEKYGDNGNWSLCVFENTALSDIMLSAYSKNCKMDFKRINCQRLIANDYFDKKEAFCNPKEADNGEKEINIVFAGLRDINLELFKMYLWAGQIPGYKLTVHVFDKNPMVLDSFYARCPEIEKYNNCTVDGEAHYSIVEHLGIDVNSKRFSEEISAIPHVSTAFISLGNDSENLECAIFLRVLFERIYDNKPKIVASVYSTLQSDIINQYSLSTIKNEDYCIDIIGDAESSYSINVLIKPHLDELAEKQQIKYKKETGDKNKNAVYNRVQAFYSAEYNYNSSIAGALRRRIRKDLGVPGAEKEPEDRNKDERLTLRKAEHAGWNTYIRTEGFVLGEKRELSKTHNCLVPFDELDEDVKKYDD